MSDDGEDDNPKANRDDERTERDEKVGRQKQGSFEGRRIVCGVDGARHAVKVPGVDLESNTDDGNRCVE